MPETFISVEALEAALKVSEPRNRLEGATITGRAFADLNCSEATFVGCTFDNVRFDHGQFDLAAFENCMFLNCRFEHCSFVDARLEGGKFFDSSARDGCSFRNCDFSRSAWNICNLASVTFEQCELQEVAAEECNLRGVKFIKSNFFRGGGKKPITHVAQFNACNLSYADMAAVTVSKCAFRNCQFTQTIMEDANFSDANLTGSALSDCETRGANFSGVNLERGKIDGLVLSQLSNFKNLKISASEQESLLAALGVTVIWED